MKATFHVAAGSRQTFGPRGFTLVELMVTIAVFALLVAIGVPTFREVALGGRLSAAANNLLASVQLARSEAIKRNLAVTLCASTDGTSCDDGADWNQGWIVHDSTLALIQRQEALPTGFRMTQTGGTAELDFQPIGIGASAAEITVCREEPPGSQERVVTVTAAGSVYIATAATGVCP
jgi:type IV fimbrial biogenesis protein FimT